MHKLFAIFSALIAVVAPLSAQSVNYPSPLGAAATEEFPYSMAGQIIFTNGTQDYQGTGTAVFKRSAVTAAHNLWDADNGWSYNVELNRARSGNSIATRAVANRLFVFGGYQSAAARYGADSLRAFASDIGGLRFTTQLAGGSYAGWKADTSLLAGDAYNVCLGYGADQHSGDDLLFVEPAVSFYRVSGAYLENDSLTFEAGMSGGPVFAEVAQNDLRMVGIIVAGSNDPPAGGIRAFDAAAARFITFYLRY